MDQPENDDNIMELILQLFGKPLAQMTANEMREAYEEVQKELRRRGYVDPTE